MNTTIELMSNIAITTDCWEWTRFKNKKGYGMVKWRGSLWFTHRLFYTLYVGPIGEQLQLHHLCGNKSCVNPRHLEPLTAKDHNLIGTSVGALNAKKTHCANGHEFSQENTRFCKIKRNGARGRLCKKCRKKWDREHYDKNRPPRMVQTQIRERGAA